MKKEMKITKRIPDEMSITLYHTDRIDGFPNYENVYWYRADEDEDGEPIERHLSYFRQLKKNKSCPVPSEKKWQQFLKQLEKIDIYSWKSREIPKIPEGVTDLEPSIWEVQIIYQDGSKFEVSGPIDELPPRFDEFCKVVSELIGEPFGTD